jgi:hypothetical protein
MTDISLPEAIQNEVARLRKTMADVDGDSSRGNPVSWVFYKLAIDAAEKAVREGDAFAQVLLLPQLKEMQ